MLVLYRLDKETKIDEELFNTIYQQYKNYIYKIALYILKNPALAEETTNDVFIKIIRHFDLFTSFNNVRRKGWLIIVTKNVALNVLHKEARCIPLEDSRLFDMIDSDEFRETFSLERLNFTLNYINRLPIRYRAVMEYYYLNRYTAKDIAKKLGLSVEAVEKRLSRGRQKLRKLIEKEVRENG